MGCDAVPASLLGGWSGRNRPGFCYHSFVSGGDYFDKHCPCQLFVPMEKSKEVRPITTIIIIIISS